MAVAAAVAAPPGKLRRHLHHKPEEMRRRAAPAVTAEKQPRVRSKSVSCVFSWCWVAGPTAWYSRRVIPSSRSASGRERPPDEIRRRVGPRHGAGTVAPPFSRAGDMTQQGHAQLEHCSCAVFSDQCPSLTTIEGAALLGAAIRWGMAPGYREDNPAGDAIGAVLKTRTPPRPPTAGVTCSRGDA